jgi:hypothetical protein
MRRRIPMTRKSLTILLALSALAVPCLSAAEGGGAAVTSFDKLPDWTGTWSMMGGTVFDRATQTGKGGSVDVGVREHPPYTAEYEKRYAAHLALRDADRYPDVQTNCGVPAGFPRILNLPDAFEFVVRPDEFYIVAENGGNTMRVYTDGRKLPAKEDTWGTYTGVSVGHWEGDTLVWETIGLKGDRDNDSILDRTGLVLSNEAKITTRMRKINDNTLEAKMVIEDSKALTKPWNVTKQFRKGKPGLYLYDYGCAENNRNPVDTKTGKTLVLGADGKVAN